VNALRQRQYGLWLLGAAVLLVLTAAFVFLTWSGWSEGGHVLVPESRLAALVGLAGMVVVFVLYGFAQQSRLQALEGELRRAELREGTLRAHFDELEALFDTSTELATHLDFRSMLDLAARRLARCLEADVCTVMLFHRGRGRLLACAVSGGDAGAEGAASARPGEGVTGLVYSTGETMVLDAEALLGQLAVEMNLKRTPSAGLSVPVRSHGATIGVINVARFDPDQPYLQVHARMLESFADSCAAALARTEGYRAATGAGEGAKSAA
jgi:transcriptional regulator with GAF, ATPase, and Fis domain